ncbi:hypothetical protein NLU13_3763 [Sarocladium strictum]|uniref:Major facilitator superfamily (MFS) profile domain-containing protein n=1 Tax=Sarocladium strictum TaxID=5046 RepID=A0AA39GHM8_SARSR|nr:hypothetical protein NLU13_3763 [Sarocladium strictum]
MSTETTTVAQPGPVHTSTHELSAIDRTTRNSSGLHERPGWEAPTQSKPPIPKSKVLAAGFSFLCAGMDGATLGPLLPHIIQSFTIGTGEVAIIYACTFAGWLLAAATNPFLAANLSFSTLLTLGATVQLLAQCLRPWAPQPLFFLSFAIQALGMAYQDSHANAWAGTLPSAHRCLGFIHAMFALGCLIGPLIATAVATAAGSRQQNVGSLESWRVAYFPLIGIHALNLIAILITFGKSLSSWRNPASVSFSTPESAERTRETREEQRNKEALREIGQLVKIKSLWLIGGFYLFNCGAWSAAGGWVVEYLTTYRNGALDRVGYVPTGFWGGLFLGRVLLAEPTHRFGEQRSIVILGVICLALQLLFCLVHNMIASAVAFSLMGFFFGPFFATGMSVASRMFPRKIQSTALGFIFVLAQAGAAIFPSLTGLIAIRAGVQVLQPVVVGLIAGGTICWWMIPPVPERMEHAEA